MLASTVFAVIFAIRRRGTFNYIVKNKSRVGSVVFSALLVAVSAAFQAWSVMFIDVSLRSDFINHWVEAALFLPTMLVFSSIMTWLDFERVKIIKPSDAENVIADGKSASATVTVNDPRRLIALPGIIGMYMFAPLFPAVIKLIVAIRRLSNR